MSAQQTVALRDIKAFPADSGLSLFASSGFFLILLVAIFLLRRKRAEQLPAIASCQPADSMDKLLAGFRSGGMGAELLFTRLSALLQYSLCGSCGRQTSAELLQQLTDAAQLDAASLADVREVMLLCDRVKFGRHQPTVSETEQCLVKAEAILATSGNKP